MSRAHSGQDRPENSQTPQSKFREMVRETEEEIDDAYPRSSIKSVPNNQAKAMAKAIVARFVNYHEKNELEGQVTRLNRQLRSQHRYRETPLLKSPFKMNVATQIGRNER